MRVMGRTIDNEFSFSGILSSNTTLVIIPQMAGRSFELSDVVWNALTTTINVSTLSLIQNAVTLYSVARSNAAGAELASQIPIPSTPPRFNLSPGALSLAFIKPAGLIDAYIRIAGNII